MKPIIAINLDISSDAPHRLNIWRNYVDSVLQAGGIPMPLPPMPKKDLEILLAKADGLLLTGGDDYSPSRYGEEAKPEISFINKDREEFDFALCEEALKKNDLPILGICGGLQLLNIVCGGTLIQDIKSALPESKVVHTKTTPGPENTNEHAVELSPGSALHSIYKATSISAPISHHQAVKDLAEGFRASAFAEDGVIEAIEHSSRPFTVGVQWHPERSYENHKALFEKFIEAAKVKSDAQMAKGIAAS